MKFLLALLLSLSCFAAPLIEGDKVQFPEVNVLTTNPGFEAAKSGWTNSGGTFAVTSTAANVARGKYAGSFDASATTQYILSPAATIPVGLQSKNCVATGMFKGGDANLALQILDGSDNILASQTLAVYSSYTRVTLNFICPTDHVHFKVLSSADAAIVYVDQLFVGDAYLVNLSQINQAEFYGGIQYPAIANCQWSSTSGSWANFATDNDCSGRVLYGKATGPADSVGNRTPSVTFASLQPGRYFVKVEGEWYNAGGECRMRISDGTNNGAPSVVAVLNNELSAHFEYTTAQTNITFNVQLYNSSGTCNINNGNTSFATKLMISLYRFPLQSDLAYKADVNSQYAIVKHQSDCRWPFSNASPAFPTGDATCTFSTSFSNNFPTVTSYADGTGNQPGIKFTPTKTGAILVCASLAGLSSNNAVTARAHLYDIDASLEIARADSYGTSTGYFIANGMLCGIKRILALSEQHIAVYPSVNTSSANLESGITWNLMYISDSLPMPQIVNSVSSNTSGQERIERLGFGGAAGSQTSPTRCTSDPCTIYTQSGNWVSSVNRSAAGQYVVNLVAGTFSASPVCTSGGTGLTRMATPAIVNTSTSVVNIYLGSDTAESVDGFVDIICMGPK